VPVLPVILAVVEGIIVGRALLRREGVGEGVDGFMVLGGAGDARRVFLPPVVLHILAAGGAGFIDGELASGLLPSCRGQGHPDGDLVVGVAASVSLKGPIAPVGSSRHVVGRHVAAGIDAAGSVAILPVGEVLPVRNLAHVSLAQSFTHKTGSEAGDFAADRHIAQGIAAGFIVPIKSIPYLQRRITCTVSFLFARCCRGSCCRRCRRWL